MFCLLLRASPSHPKPRANGRGGVLASAAGRQVGEAADRTIYLAGKGTGNAVKGTDNAGKGTDNAGKGTDNAGKGTDDACKSTDNACKGTDNAF
jgi:hypothetical protein